MRHRARPALAGAAAGCLIGLVALCASSTAVAGPLPAAPVEDACAPPALVTSSASDVAAGVHYSTTVAYTAVVDDACLPTTAGQVSIEVYRDGVGYTDEPATFSGMQGTNQQWTATFSVDPLHTRTSSLPLLTNDFAGVWGSLVHVAAPAGSTTATDLPGATFRVRRYSEILSTNASEPTPKGGTETVVGKLARASWVDNVYHGNAYQPVALQFRTLTGSYSTVKTVSTDASGGLRTTTTATVSGCYRWSFAGTDETPPATAPGDCVDVT